MSWARHHWKTRSYYHYSHYCIPSSKLVRQRSALLQSLVQFSCKLLWRRRRQFMARRSSREETESLRNQFVSARREKIATRSSLQPPKLTVIRDSQKMEDVIPFRVKREAACRTNLSTPKYFTRFNNREVSLMPRPIQTADKISCESLNTPRLHIPKFRVPSNLPELAAVTSLVEGNTTPERKDHYRNYKSSTDSRDWLSLIQRNVPARPQFAEPIHCKTPALTGIQEENKERLVRSMFDSVHRKGSRRNFTVHPEFVSEYLRLGYIAGQSSNPLKYGWLG